MSRRDALHTLLVLGELGPRVLRIVGRKEGRHTLRIMRPAHTKIDLLHMSPLLKERGGSVGIAR